MTVSLGRTRARWPFHGHYFPLLQLTLNLLTSLSGINKSNMTSISVEILPQILLLVQSPLLQGGALQALLEFLQSIVRLGLPKLGFRDLLQVG